MIYYNILQLKFLAKSGIIYRQNLRFLRCTMFYELDHPIVSDYFFVGMGRDFNFPAHIHHCYEIVFVTSGEMIVTVGGVDYTLRERDAILIFSNQIHSMRTPERSTHKLFVFAPNLISAYTGMIGEKVPKNCLYHLDDVCYKMNMKADVGEGLFEVKSMLYYNCAIFHANTEYTDAETDSKSLIYRILMFIQQNYGKNCTLDDLSKSTGYDYSYLSRYFKRIVGMSFNDYVNSVRISHACYLLTNTDYNILSVCTECGFKSLRSLNRNFKEQLGESPSEYRRARIGAEMSERFSVRLDRGLKYMDIDEVNVQT